MAKVEYKEADGKFICIFSGRIDTAAATELEEELIDRVQHTHDPVVFDFSKLEYVASAFLRTCVKLARITGSSKIRVIKASEDIRHIFSMTGFDKLMDIENEEEH